jgi:hypothetical protein
MARGRSRGRVRRALFAGPGRAVLAAAARGAKPPLRVCAAAFVVATVERDEARGLPLWACPGPEDDRAYGLCHLGYLERVEGRRYRPTPAGVAFADPFRSLPLWRGRGPGTLRWVDLARALRDAALRLVRTPPAPRDDRS